MILWIVDVFSKIKLILGDEIDYCICWSTKKYEDCCKIKINNFLNLTSEKLNEIEPSSQDYSKLIEIISEIYWKDIVWDNVDWPKCIKAACNSTAIWSHLFWNKYLQKHISNTKLFIPNKIRSIKKIQSPNSLKTHLFCGDHDLYFEPTDTINDFIEVISTPLKIYNFFIKTLYFRLKFASLWMRLLIIDIIELAKEWVDIKEILWVFNELYKLYNFLCEIIYNFEDKKDIWFTILCNWTFDKQKGNMFYSNIVFKKNIPYYVCIVNDNSGSYFIIWYIQWYMPSEKDLLDIKNITNTSSGSETLKNIIDFFELWRWINIFWYTYWNNINSMIFSDLITKDIIEANSKS